jgi:hypothetical protein
MQLYSRFNTINIPRVRQFWNLSTGSAIGFIESYGSAGIFFKNDLISFRITSSNISNGSVVYLSLNNCTTDALTINE